MDAWMNFSVLQLVSWGLWCVISFTTFVLPRLEHTIIVKEIAVNLLVNSFIYVFKGWGNSAANYHDLGRHTVLLCFVSFHQRTRFGLKFKVLFFYCCGQYGKIITYQFITCVYNILCSASWRLPTPNASEVIN